MRCTICSAWSVAVFCKNCTKSLLVPSLSTRKVGSLDVLSFFKYVELEVLLLSKHQAHGYRIYKALAKLSFRPFIEEFLESQEDKADKIYIIGIDESVKSGYSHVALLTHAMKYPNTKVLHAVLMAKNKVKYAGKSLEFRLDNPRNFIYKGKENIKAILVDDIITTGQTIKEAQKVLERHHVEVLFALTLADVRE